MSPIRFMEAHLMATTGSRSRLRRRPIPASVGKPRGVLHPRVQQVGPDHFGIVCFDCAKVRSKFLLADFYGRLLLYMASIKASRLMKSICMARIPKRRLRSEDDMANHLET